MTEITLRISDSMMTEITLKISGSMFVEPLLILLKGTKIDFK